MSLAFFTFIDFASGSFALDFLFVDRVVEVDGTFLGPLSCSSTACTVSFAFSMVTAVFLNDISCFSFCDFEPAENIQRAPGTVPFSVMQSTIMILLPFPTLSFVHRRFRTPQLKDVDFLQLLSPPIPFLPCGLHLTMFRRYKLILSEALFL